MKTIDPAAEAVCGTWKGYYGTENGINAITIKIDPQNKAEIICDHPGTCLKTTGTYKLLGDSAIVISYPLDEKRSAEVILHGNLNRTSSFIDGNWDGEGNEGGCFYLQKQMQKMDL